MKVEEGKTTLMKYCNGGNVQYRARGGCDSCMISRYLEEYTRNDKTESSLTMRRKQMLVLLRKCVV